MNYYVDTTGMGHMNPIYKDIMKGKQVVTVDKQPSWNWREFTDKEPISLSKLAMKYAAKYLNSHDLPSTYVIADQNLQVGLINNYIHLIVGDTTKSVSSNLSYDVLRQASVFLAEKRYGSNISNQTYNIYPNVLNSLRNDPEMIYIMFALYGVLPYNAYFDLGALYVSKYVSVLDESDDNLLFVGGGKSDGSKQGFIHALLEKSNTGTVFLRPENNSLFAFNAIGFEYERFVNNKIRSLCVNSGEVKAVMCKERTLSNISYVNSSSNIANNKQPNQKNVLLVKSKRELSYGSKLEDGTVLNNKTNYDYKNTRQWSIVEAAFDYCFSCNSIEADTKLKVLSSVDVFDKIVSAYQGAPAFKKCCTGDYTYCILDTETTGLDTARDVIVEFAAVMIHNGEIIESCDILRKSAVDIIQDNITNLTGITKDLLLEEGLDDVEFDSTVKRFVSCDFVIAYNSSFDLKIIESTLKFVPKYVIDLFDLVKLFYPKLESYKLGDVGNYLNLKGQNTHRAIDDVMLTVELHEKCLEEYFKYTEDKADKLSEDRKALLKLTSERVSTGLGYSNINSLVNAFQTIINVQDPNEAKTLLVNVGVPKDFIERNWDINLSVGANLNRFINEPNKIVEEGIFAATVYDLKDVLYDAIYLNSYDTKTLPYIKSRTLVSYVNGGDTGEVIGINNNALIDKDLEIKCLYHVEDLYSEIGILGQEIGLPVSCIMYKPKPNYTQNNDDYNYWRTTVGLRMALSYNYVRYKTSADGSSLKMQISSGAVSLNTFCETLLNNVYNGNTSYSCVNGLGNVMSSIDFTGIGKSIVDLIKGFSLKTNVKYFVSSAVKRIQESGINLDSLIVDTKLGAYSILALYYTKAIEELFYSRRIPVLLKPLGFTNVDELINFVYSLEKVTKEMYESNDENRNIVTIEGIVREIECQKVFDKVSEVDLEMLYDMNLRNVEAVWRYYLPNESTKVMSVDLTRFHDKDFSISGVCEFLQGYIADSDNEFYLIDETSVWFEKLGSISSVRIKTLQNSDKPLKLKYKSLLVFRRIHFLFVYIKQKKDMKLKGVYYDDARVAGINMSTRNKVIHFKGALAKASDKPNKNNTVLLNRFYTRRCIK